MQNWMFAVYETGAIMLAHPAPVIHAGNVSSCFVGSIVCRWQFVSDSESGVAADVDLLICPTHEFVLIISRDQRGFLHVILLDGAGCEVITDDFNRSCTDSREAGRCRLADCVVGFDLVECRNRAVHTGDQLDVHTALLLDGSHGAGSGVVVMREHDVDLVMRCKQVRHRVETRGAVEFAVCFADNLNVRVLRDRVNDDKRRNLHFDGYDAIEGPERRCEKKRFQSARETGH